MFDIFTDSSSNLTSDNSDSLGIKIISYTCEIGGAEMLCYDENRPFEDTAREYYTKMRAGADVRTTLISAGRLSDAFEPSLKAGRDVLFVGMSSGLTGTLQAAKMAASSLSEKYPNVRCEVCDSFAASLGEGLMVIRVAEMRKSGVSLDGALSWLEQNKMSMSQVFTVDDLKYLRRGGRISGIAALVGNLLHVKPILRATNAGTTSSSVSTTSAQAATSAPAPSRCFSSPQAENKKTPKVRALRALSFFLPVHKTGWRAPLS
jgi:DegV family protein with EDD domain